MGNLSAVPSSLNQHDKRILEYLTHHGTMEVGEVVKKLNMEEGDVNRALFRLTKSYEPLVNRIGTSSKYKLSVKGCKLLNVTAPPVVTQAPPAAVLPSSIGPGPRGLIIKSLKERPYSATELARLTGLNIAQVHYFLKTLGDRGILGVREISARDGRVTLYRLKQFSEPEKPILTPSIVPMADDGNWQTWFERLCLEQLGGPTVVMPEIERNEPACATPTKNNGRHLPKILIVGYADNHLVSALQSYKGRAKFYFFNSKDRSSGLQMLCKKMNYILLRYEYVRHADMHAIKSSNRKFTPVSGNAMKIAQFVEKILGMKP